MRKIRRTLVVEHGFAKGSAVEYKSRTAGNQWVSGHVESLGKDLITVLYEVEIQGKMTQMRKSVHVSDLDACLRFHHATVGSSSGGGPMLQEDEQQGRSFGGSTGGAESPIIAVTGLGHRSLSRVAEEGQVPTAPSAAFQSLLSRLDSAAPRVSLEWLRTAGGGPLYESVLCSEQLGPLGGSSGRWEHLYCVLWPQQADRDYGRFMICYQHETLCQFGKGSEWHRVRVSLSGRLLTVVCVDDGSAHTALFQSSKTFLSMVCKPKRTEEAGQCVFTFKMKLVQ